MHQLHRRAGRLRLGAGRGLQARRPAEDRGLARRAPASRCSTRTTRSSSRSRPTARERLPRADRRCRVLDLNDARRGGRLPAGNRRDAMSTLAPDTTSRAAAADAGRGAGAAARRGPRRSPDDRGAVSTFDALGRVLAERRALGARRAAGRQHLDGRLRAALRRRAGGRHRAAGQPAHPGRRGRRSRCSPARAARIFTGAQVPAGADAVVMQEQCEARRRGRRAHRTSCRQPGQWIRRRGEDVRHGAVVLRARHAAHAAGARPGGLGRRGRAAGGAPPARGAVLHRRRTGDARRAAAARRDLQLQPLHAARPAAGAGLRGATTSASCPTGSTPRATRCAAAAQGNDLIVTSGGVSVGEEDHLRPAVQAEGRLELWQIAIKPGKPLAFGEVRRGDGCARAGSSACRATRCRASSPSCWRCGRCCCALQGAPAAPPRRLPLRADFDWPRPDRRREFLRVRRNADGGARAVPEPELGRADLGRLGRRPGRQPARAGHPRAATRCASCRSRSWLRDEGPGALLRLAARGAGRRRDASSCRPARTRRRACATR